jgi:hypothetical protein
VGSRPLISSVNPAGALTALTDTTEQNRLQPLSYNESLISESHLAAEQFRNKRADTKMTAAAMDLHKVATVFA